MKPTSDLGPNYVGLSISLLCMLGLQPRLRARNSLWDLVNKPPYPQDHQLSPQPPWQQQPVEEEADGLPPLPISPTSPLPAPPNHKPYTKAVVEEQTPVKMAPVSCTFAGALSTARQSANCLCPLHRRKRQNDTAKKLVKTSMVLFTLSQGPSLWRRT